MRMLNRSLLVAVCFAFCSIGIAHAASQFSFINSNNGAALNSGSNKTNCLRGMMMAPNHDVPNAWDCVSDTCYQHNTTIQKGKIYSCVDIPSPNGTPDRLCKIDGPWTTWRTVVYNQSVSGCTAFAQGCYTSGGSTCGAAIASLSYNQHILTVW